MSRNRSAKAQTKRMILAQENTIAFTPNAKTVSRPVNLIPRTRNQEHLVMALTDETMPIVVTAGPAGSGKTYLAMLAAIKALRSSQCDRIVLTRPAVGVEGEQHGFLPGNLIAKMEPWTRPLLDVMREFYRVNDIMTMLEDQVLEIAPLAYMRGRTFKNSWIIADEMQNATPAQVKMLMTRIGSNSKIVITGDVEQADRNSGSNGLLDLCTRLKSQTVPGIAVCSMELRDVQRHPIIASVLEMYAH